MTSQELDSTDAQHVALAQERVQRVAVAICEREWIIAVKNDNCLVMAVNSDLVIDDGG